MGFPDEAKYYLEESEAALAAADAHDAANNVHRVSLDDATVERVARALWNGNTEADWDLLDESSTIAHGVKDRYRQVARAVLAAAVEGKP
jgi:nucleotidyltransferase/DNA polymerase involved in DNA repair